MENILEISQSAIASANNCNTSAVADGGVGGGGEVAGVSSGGGGDGVDVNVDIADGAGIVGNVGATCSGGVIDIAGIGGT